MKLRPLVVLTGTLHVEGGDRTRDSQAREPDGTLAPGLIVREKKISPDRRKANTIVTSFMRILRQKIIIIRTPFGALLDPRNLSLLRRAMREFDKQIRQFNREVTPRVRVKPVRLTNAVLVEPLQGIRQAAVEGWVNRQYLEGNPAVHKVLAQLVEPPEVKP